MTLADRFSLPRVDDLRLTQAHVVIAVRLCVMHAHASLDPVPPLATKLRNVAAARALADLSMMIDACWPDGFALHRPCCRALSADEATLAALVDAVERDATRAPHRLLGEMLPPDQITALAGATARAVGLIGMGAHRSSLHPRP